MRDHEDGHAAVTPEPVEQREDPRPHRDVEHRDGFVGHQECRVEHQAGGDGDTLALPPRQLMGEPLDEQVGRRELHALERLDHESLSLVLGSPDPVDHHGFLDRTPHAESRIQRLVGVLIDHLHAAPGRTQPSGRESSNVSPRDEDRSRGGLHHPQDRLRRRGLAASRFTHQGDHLATTDGQRDAVDRGDVPAGFASEGAAQPTSHRVPDDEVSHVEQVLCVEVGEPRPER